MKQHLNFQPLEKERIEQVADIDAKYAREMTILKGRHENELRDLQRRHWEEIQELDKPKVAEEIGGK